MQEVVFSLLSEKSIKPSKAREGSVGYDVFAFNDKIIPKKSVKKVCCGFKMKMSSGLFALMKSRSSYVLKNLSVEAGVIDSDYRGLIYVCIRNHNNTDVLIKSDSKIAQMIFFNCINPKINVLESIDNDTERGEGGFGSTDEGNDDKVFFFSN